MCTEEGSVSNFSFVKMHHVFGSAPPVFVYVVIKLRVECRSNGYCVCLKKKKSGGSGCFWGSCYDQPFMSDQRDMFRLKNVIGTKNWPLVGWVNIWFNTMAQLWRKRFGRWALEIRQHRPCGTCFRNDRQICNHTVNIYVYGKCSALAKKGFLRLFIYIRYLACI